MEVAFQESKEKAQIDYSQDILENENKSISDHSNPAYLSLKDKWTSTFPFQHQ